MRGPDAEPLVLPSPTTCPFCGASKIAAQSEKVDSTTYWRCEVCGEMWNLGRLRMSPSRYNGSPRWK